jgi:hypothetical protein
LKFYAEKPRKIKIKEPSTFLFKISIKIKENCKEYSPLSKISKEKFKTPIISN